MENLTIKKVTAPDKQVLKAVVDIHLATFPGFFLTFMGRGFLYQMYKAYTLHEPSTLLVANQGGKTVGFLSCSRNMSGLYKYMIKHQLVQFGWYSLGAFLRKPEVFLRLIRAFLKPGEAGREEKYVQLSSIGVAPDAKGLGIGSRLIDAVKEIVDFSEYAYIGLETDAVDNQAANHFYVKNGFRRVREYATHEGRKMFEYRYEGGSDLENRENALHTEYSQAGQ